MLAHNEAVTHVLELTGCDLSDAFNLLERHSGNVERAVNAFFDARLPASPEDNLRVIDDAAPDDATVLDGTDLHVYDDLSGFDSDGNPINDYSKITGRARDLPLLLLLPASTSDGPLSPLPSSNLVGWGATNEEEDADIKMDLHAYAWDDDAENLRYLLDNRPEAIKHISHLIDHQHDPNDQEWPLLDTAIWNCPRTARVLLEYDACRIKSPPSLRLHRQRSHSSSHARLTRPSV